MDNMIKSNSLITQKKKKKKKDKILRISYKVIPSVCEYDKSNILFT